jgi:hypothetical protein
VSHHVAKIILEHAKMNGFECAIKLEPIDTLDHVAIGYCGHIFCKDVEVENKCPACRTPTSWTIIENKRTTE